MTENPYVSPEPVSEFKRKRCWLLAIAALLFGLMLGFYVGFLRGYAVGYADGQWGPGIRVLRDR